MDHKASNQKVTIYIFVHRRGKSGVSGRRARDIERGRVPVEMDEVALDDQATSDIGST